MPYPVVDPNRPFGQFGQDDEYVDEYLPFGQMIGAEAPPDGQYDPAGHIVNVVLPEMEM